MSVKAKYWRYFSITLCHVFYNSSKTKSDSVKLIWYLESTHNYVLKKLKKLILNFFSSFLIFQIYVLFYNFWSSSHNNCARSKPIAHFKTMKNFDPESMFELLMAILFILFILKIAFNVLNSSGAVIGKFWQNRSHWVKSMNFGGHIVRNEPVDLTRKARRDFSRGCYGNRLNVKYTTNYKTLHRSAINGAIHTWHTPSQRV